MQDYSQYGETTIIATAVEYMEGKCVFPKVAVEIGAGDGYHLSNIRGLLEDGWRGFQLDKIEGLAVYCVHVTAENINWEIMFRMPIVDALDSEIGVLSIDVDGNDFWLWRALTEYRPYIVVIEFNPTLDGSLVMTYDANHCWSGVDNYFGASFNAIIKLGHHKGYKVIARTHCNLVFARAEFRPDTEPVFLHEPEPVWPCAIGKQFQEV